MHKKIISMASRFVTFTALSFLDSFIPPLHVYFTYLGTFGQARTKDIHKCSKHKIFQWKGLTHDDDVTMSAMASQITSLTIVYSTVHSDPDQRKPQTSASLAFVREIHQGPVNSPHKWPVTRKMSPFDDVIMYIVD